MTDDPRKRLVDHLARAAGNSTPAGSPAVIADVLNEHNVVVLPQDAEFTVIGPIAADPELMAIMSATQHLSRLSHAAQQRAVAYLRQRFIAPPDAEDS